MTSTRDEDLANALQILEALSRGTEQGELLWDDVVSPWALNPEASSHWVAKEVSLPHSSITIAWSKLTNVAGMQVVDEQAETVLKIDAEEREAPAFAQRVASIIGTIGHRQREDYQSRLDVVFRDLGVVPPAE
jgi:hypothetical protein